MLTDHLAGVSAVTLDFPGSELSAAGTGISATVLAAIWALTTTPGMC